MGLGNIFRRKKEEDILNMDLAPTSPGMGQEHNSMNDPMMSSSFGQGSNPMDSVNLSNMNMQSSNSGFQPGGQDLQKDIQILSLKLDSIKSELDAINQRIKNIESIAEKEQVQPRQKWY